MTLHEKVGQANQPKYSITLLMSYYICSTYYIRCGFSGRLYTPWKSPFISSQDSITVRIFLLCLAISIIQNILPSIIAKAINRKVSSQEFLVFIINYALLSVFYYTRTATQIQYYKGMNLL